MILTLKSLAAASGTASYPPDHDYWYTSRVPETAAGVSVDGDTALCFSTVFACVNKLAKTLATLPAHVYERVGGRREPRPEHWLQQIWTRRFHPEVLALTGREALMANLLLWGNAYAECVFNRGGDELAALVPLYSRYMRVERATDDGPLRYVYNPPANRRRVLGPEQVLHVPGLSLNGIVGLSVIGYQRLAVGLGMAATQHGASFFSNGAIPGVVLERPAEAPDLDEEGGRRILRGWNDDFMGPGNHYRTALLEEGMKATAIGMPLKDAQFLESRQFQRVEICAIFDVPPSKIHDHQRSTWNNVEQMNLDWRTDSLVPWCVRLEQAVDARFLEGTALYLKHNLEGIVRGDMVARSTHYQKMIRCGMSINEWREKEDLDGIGPEGDVRFISKDLVPLEQAIEKPAPPPPALRAFPPPGPDQSDEDEDEEGRQQENEGARQRTALMGLAAEASARIVTKEVKAVGNAVKRYLDKTSAQWAQPEAFGGWLDRFYAGQIGYAFEAWQPVCEAAAALQGTPAAETVARGRAEGYAQTSLAAIREAARDPAYVMIELSRWGETKAATLAAGLIAALFDH